MAWAFVFVSETLKIASRYSCNGTALSALTAAESRQRSPRSLSQTGLSHDGMDPSCKNSQTIHPRFSHSCNGTTTASSAVKTRLTRRQLTLPPLFQVRVKDRRRYCRRDGAPRCHTRGCGTRHQTKVLDRGTLPLPDGSNHRPNIPML